MAVKQENSHKDKDDDILLQPHYDYIREEEMPLWLIEKIKRATQADCEELEHFEIDITSEVDCETSEPELSFEFDEDISAYKPANKGGD